MRVSLAALVQSYTKVLCAGKGLWRAEWHFSMAGSSTNRQRPPALPGALAARIGPSASRPRKGAHAGRRHGQFL